MALGRAGHIHSVWAGGGGAGGDCGAGGGGGTGGPVRSESVHDTQTIKHCMTQVGYRFDY